MRFKLLVEGLIFFVFLTLSIVLYKNGYFITGNLYVKGLTIDSKKQLSQLKNYLVDDRKRIVWWKLKFSNDINVENNKILYGTTISTGDVVTGCAENRFVLNGFVKIVEVFINSDLWTLEKQKNSNIVFVKCSLLSYDEDYQKSIIDYFVDQFNGDQYILKIR